jgi:hypothetical protein
MLGRCWFNEGSSRACKTNKKDLEAANPKHSFEEFFAQLMTSSAGLRDGVKVYLRMGITTHRKELV